MNKLKKHLFIINVLTMSALNMGGAYASSTQVARYSSVENKATASQVNPLLAIQSMRFPTGVKTIGEAAEYWIRHTGYKLVDDKNRTAETNEILSQNLPQVDRRLGPITVKEGLEVLVGKGVFNLVQDPLHRRVNFELTKRYKNIYTSRSRG